MTRQQAIELLNKYKDHIAGGGSREEFQLALNILIAKPEAPGGKAVGTVLGGVFHYLSVNHGLPDGTKLYAAIPPTAQGDEK